MQEKNIDSTPKKRRTYTQNWVLYNRAKTSEKALFYELLHRLCQTLADPQPCKRKRGKPPALLSDIVFCLIQRVYNGVSGRIGDTDVVTAYRDGYISHPLSFNTITKHFERKELTPILHKLITISSLPLKDIEKEFAVDSSGFSTGNNILWNRAKRGKSEVWHDWLKLHMICGVKTNIVVAVEISERYSHDSLYFKTLFDSLMDKGFDVRAIMADKGYSTKKIVESIFHKNVIPYIHPKTNAKLDPFRSSWNKLLAHFWLHEEEFLRNYHKRSNVETAFSIIKRRFGETLRNHTETAKNNELLAKVICLNITVLINEIHELGLEPEFICL